MRWCNSIYVDTYWKKIITLRFILFTFFSLPCCSLSSLPSIFPLFYLSYLPSFHPFFLPSILPSIHASFLSSFLPSFLSFIRPSYLPCFLSSFLLTFPLSPFHAQHGINHTRHLQCLPLYLYSWAAGQKRGGREESVVDSTRGMELGLEDSTLFKLKTELLLSLSFSSPLVPLTSQSESSFISLSVLS